MRFDILTLFPELIKSHLDFSIIKRAKDDGVIQVNTINPRDYTLDKHKKVDDTPYGGGVGMVLAPQPYVDAYAGRSALEMVLAIYKSQKTGEIVKFPLKEFASTDMKGEF